MAGTKGHSGGKRLGSGRKPTPFKRRTLRLQTTDDEWTKLLNSLPKGERNKAMWLLKQVADKK